jgi:hypothetical protein
MTDTKPQNEVVNVGQSKLTNVHIDDELMRMGGAGTENVKAKDVLIPRLVILQSLSPQLAKKKPEYIEDAEVGDFCNVATGDIYKKEIEVIPCHFATAYIEWVKNRGGFAFNHGDNSKILDSTSRTEKNENILPNGNVIQETAQWYCLLKDGASWTRVFFPLKSTGLKHSRKWLTILRSETLKVNGKDWKPPLFWRSWKLTIVDESNDQGDWASFKPERGEEVAKIDESRQLLRLCMNFYEEVKGNIVRGEVVQDDGNPVIDGTINKDIKDKDIPF